MMIQKRILIPLILLTSLISCKDKISSVTDSSQQVITPVTEDKCDNSLMYDGLTSFADITDASVKLSWAHDTESIGYTIFKEGTNGLEIVQNLPKTTFTYEVTGLSEETDYSFIVRTININGHYDCNKTLQSITTTQKQTFNSCHEINQYYGGIKPSGIYEIDTDLAGPKAPFDVYCDMDNNSGGWTRVFTHNTVAGLFANDAEAIETNITDVNNDKYSILSKLEEFRRNGKFEFWLYYPEVDGADGGNIWTQLSNPATDLINGYVGIREDWTGKYWGGLEKSNYSGTFIDGSVSYGWWYFAIGANRYWPGSGTIPGPTNGITQVQLFIK